MEPEDYGRIRYETWGVMASGWERWRAQLEEALITVRDWLINELASRPGDTVLELSAGAGDTGFAAAAIVGEGGRLISTDDPGAAQLTEAFVPFVTDGGYELPGLALTAVAS